MKYFRTYIHTYIHVTLESDIHTMYIRTLEKIMKFILNFIAISLQSHNVQFHYLLVSISSLHHPFKKNNISYVVLSVNSLSSDLLKSVK